MLTYWLVATLHLLALGLGLGAVWTRARTLRAPLDAPALRRVFYADAFWGVAALIWISTGLLRAFGGLEKGTAYYLASSAFWIKMALLGLILVLELWPMAALVRWRIRQARGEAVDTRRARLFGAISYVQAGLVVAMVLAATAMARGIGA